MTKLEIIDQRTLLEKNFKIYGTLDNPLFLAKDVAEWIDYSYESKSKGIRKVSQLVDMVEEEEKIKGIYNVATTIDGINVATTSRRTQETWFLTEDGLYEVLMQSRKPIAKSFKKEVKMILKQIRKTGGYIPIEKEMTESEIMAKALLISQRTIEKKDELLKAKETVIKEKTVELDEKNKFIGQISASKNSMLVRDVAHLVTKHNIKIGEKRLWNKLREWGLIFKDSTKPKQVGLERGLFEVSLFTIQTNHGISTKATTRVTGKGQAYIINKLLLEA